jgi:uncharacterized membrane protein
MFGGAAAMMILLGVLAIAASVFWLWMLVDALVNERDTNQKILWFLVIFFLHFVGAIIYFAVRKSGGVRTSTG